MKKKIRRALAILAAFCIAFTGLPLMTGSLNAHAAGKFTIRTAEAVSSDSVKLTWKKYRKSNTYEVYRDGELVDTVSKTGYTDEGLQASTEYVYRVKALQKYTKKQKQWFNKKTGEWQKKKPPKKYRGKSKTVKLVKYKTLGTSKPKAVTTKAAPRPPFDNTDRDQDLSSVIVVSVPRLDHINVEVDYSHTEELKDRVTPGYTQRFEYNKNGLLKKSTSSADTSKWGNHFCGTISFSYNGSKIREMYVDDGDFLPEKYVYSYENGKLKSRTHSYPTAEDDDEPSTEYYIVNSMGRVEQEYYKDRSNGNKDTPSTDYQYTSEGYLSRQHYAVNPDDWGSKFVYDAHGNPVKTIHEGRYSPISSDAKTLVNTADNSYKNGMLTTTCLKRYNGIITKITFSYKEAFIPEEYLKAFTAQQHDILFRYAYAHFMQDFSILDLPIGLVG